MFVFVGVGVGVGSQFKYNNSSQPVESVAITKTSDNGSSPSKKMGVGISKTGGTDTTPVNTTSQYVLVLSQIVIS